MGEVVSINAGMRGPEAEARCAACPARRSGLCAAADTGSELACRLGGLSERVTLEPGDVLVRQGDAARHVFAVVAGTLKVTRVMADGRAQISGFLSGGELLGLPGMECGTYVYEAVALTRTSVCRFNRDRLVVLTDDFPAVRRRLLAMTAGELAAAQEQMLLLGRKSAIEKVASFLLQLQAKAARRGVGGTRVQVPMSRAEIGDHLGLTIETVSRCVSKLKTAGSIRLVDTHTIEIRDPTALSELAAAA
ncbi:MAG TPA: helix-turn-helix domain-containing protein [Azospirillaceae bacterium]|nr:helix-turn-helix domain-containing protein [Azospirillaceae bacterium]